MQEIVIKVKYYEYNFIQNVKGVCILTQSICEEAYFDIQGIIVYVFVSSYFACLI